MLTQTSVRWLKEAAVLQTPSDGRAKDRGSDRPDARPAGACVALASRPLQRVQRLADEFRRRSERRSRSAYAMQRLIACMSQRCSSAGARGCAVTSWLVPGHGSIVETSEEYWVTSSADLKALFCVRARCQSDERKQVPHHQFGSMARVGPMRIPISFSAVLYSEGGLSVLHQLLRSSRGPLASREFSVTDTTLTARPAKHDSARLARIISRSPRDFDRRRMIVAPCCSWPTLSAVHYGVNLTSTREPSSLALHAASARSALERQQRRRSCKAEESQTWFIHIRSA